MEVYTTSPEILKYQQGVIIQRVVIDPSSSCWNWTQSLNNQGYGMVKISQPFRKQVTTHRLAYMAFVGPIPDGLFVCHTCDNRKCCNPDHLFLGTNSENIHDRINKKEAQGIYAIHTARELRRKGEL